MKQEQLRKDSGPLRSACNFEIRANDQKKIAWDSFIILIAIWNAVTVPLEICFDPEIIEIFDKFHYFTLDKCFNIIFFIDIGLNSITTFYDTDGEEIFDKPRIL